MPLEDDRNVQDFLKFLPVDETKRWAAERRSPFGVLLANIEYDINVGSSIRTANNFNAREVFYYGRKKYNKVGALGTYLYMDVSYCASIEETVAKTGSYSWVGFEQTPDSVDLSGFSWPDNPLLVFGHENSGFDLMPEVAYNIKHWVKIPSLGTVRSLNVGAAVAIACYDFCAKKGLK